MKNGICLEIIIFSLCLLCFTNVICLADSSLKIEQAQAKVVSLIEDKDFTSAQQAIDSMKVDFANYPNLAQRLYEVGHEYNQAGNQAEFRFICEQLVLSCSKSKAAGHAQLYLKRFDIEDLVKSGKIADSKIAIAKMKNDFAGHPDLGCRLYEIAYSYMAIGDYDTFRSICEYVVSECSESVVTADAQMCLLRFDIEELVKSGKIDDSELAIAKMKKNFAGQPHLGCRLYEIAHSYAAIGEQSAFRAMCEYIVSKCSEAVVTPTARLHLARIGIEELIMSGKIADSQIAVVKMKNDFAGHSELPMRLREIACKYDRAGESAMAKEIYSQVLELSVPSSDVHIESEVNVKKYDIFKLIEADDRQSAMRIINQLLAQTTGDRQHWRAAFFLAEEMSIAGKIADNKKFRQTSDYALLASLLLEEHVLPLGPDYYINVDALFILADCYKELGNYVKTVDCYEQIVAGYPNHHLAWHAQFMIGKSYEKMLKAGQISKSQANSQSRAAYQKVLRKYPNCKAAKVSQRQLKKISHKIK